jgi:ABC-type transporter Mla MlaB component
MARRTKASAAAAAVQPPLALPAELTIYTVGDLHPLWLQWLQQGAAAAPAEVQAQAVDQVDGAGLQLLLGLTRAAAERGRTLRIDGPSEVLRAGCQALGLGDWLQAHAGAGAGA